MAYQVAGCRLSSQRLRRFTILFVGDPAPFLLDAATAAALPAEVPVVDRAAFGAVPLPLTYRDVYGLYDLPTDSTGCAFLTARVFERLPATLQTRLVAQQWAFGRGHVSRWEQVASFLTGIRDDLLGPRRCATPDGDVLLLDRRLWRRLTPVQRRRWLLWYLAEDQLQCVAHTLPPAFWADLSPVQRHVLPSAVGVFPPTSGPNCFGTTLMALAPSVPAALAIGNQWVQRETFLALLADYGFADAGPYHATETPPRDTVVLWRDTAGDVQHSAYVIKDGLALNKNAQTWFAPRQIVPLDDLVRYWQDDAATVRLSRRP